VDTRASDTQRQQLFLPPPSVGGIGSRQQKQRLRAPQLFNRPKMGSTILYTLLLSAILRHKYRSLTLDALLVVVILV